MLSCNMKGYCSTRYVFSENKQLRTVDCSKRLMNMEQV